MLRLRSRRRSFILPRKMLYIVRYVGSINFTGLISLWRIISTTRQRIATKSNQPYISFIDSSSDCICTHHFYCIACKTVCRPVCNEMKNLHKSMIYRGLLKNSEVWSVQEIRVHSTSLGIIIWLWDVWTMIFNTIRLH